jgi:voltage-gated potassium channel
MSSREAYERFQRAAELPMLVLALLFLPILLAPMLLDLTSAAETALEVGAWMIWGVFATEYVVLLYLAPVKREMIRTHVLDLVIIVLPFLRPLRAVRALRLLRTGAAIGRGGVALRRIATRRGFRGFVLLVLGVIAAGGTMTWAFERGHPDGQIGSLVDGVWWAVVTSTTVGYGDMVPVTPEGRGVAVLLMLVGIALLSVVTANVAAFFVEESAEGSGNEDVLARLDRIERLLAERL